MLFTFCPTHRIVFTPRTGGPEEWIVMLNAEEGREFSFGENAGPAYTADECRHYDSAAWELHDDGRWYFQGRSTPHNQPGTVTVLALNFAEADELQEAI